LTFLSSDNSKCELCQAPCEACFSQNICKTCAPGNYLLFNSTQCSPACPDKFFGDQLTHICKPCFFTCKTCVGESSTECLKCDIENGYTKDSDAVGDCKLAVCPDGFYSLLNLQSSRIECLKCHESCAKCDRSDSPSYCLECKKPLFTVPNAIPGHYKCQKCEEYFAGTTTGPDGKCIEICGDGLNIGLLECDDGNLIDGDGCNSQCKIEDGFKCIRREKDSDYCYDIVQPTATLHVLKENVLFIEFSENVLASFKTFSEFVSKIQLQIEGIEHDCYYSWSLHNTVSQNIKFTNLTIHVKLNCSLQENAQIFTVEFKSDKMITDPYGNKLATPILSARSKRYIYISDTAKDIVDGTGSSFSMSGFVTFGIILGINLLQSTAVESFWAFMNMLQMLMYIPIISCELPYNLEIFLTQYLSVGRVAFPFKMLPTWIPNPINWIKSKLVLPFDMRFSICGFDSLSFIYNFSEQLFTWILLLVFYLAVRFLCLIIPETSCSIVHKWRKDYEFNTPIRVLIETYLNMTFCSFLNIWFVFLALVC